MFILSRKKQIHSVEKKEILKEKKQMCFRALNAMKIICDFPTIADRLSYMSFVTQNTEQAPNCSARSELNFTVCRVSVIPKQVKEYKTFLQQ